jgi:hypothetical protein
LEEFVMVGHIKAETLRMDRRRIGREALDGNAIRMRHVRIHQLIESSDMVA